MEFSHFIDIDYASSRIAQTHSCIYCSHISYTMYIQTGLSGCNLVWHAFTLALISGFNVCIICVHLNVLYVRSFVVLCIRDCLFGFVRCLFWRDVVATCGAAAAAIPALPPAGRLYTSISLLHTNTTTHESSRQNKNVQSLERKQAHIVHNFMDTANDVVQ